MPTARIQQALESVNCILEWYKNFSMRQIDKFIKKGYGCSKMSSIILMFRVSEGMFIIEIVFMLSAETRGLKSPSENIHSLIIIEILQLSFSFFTAAISSFEILAWIEILVSIFLFFIS